MTLFLTFVVFLAAVLAMVACVLITGRDIKGSCGGPSCECTAEGKDVRSCEVEAGNGISLPMHRTPPGPLSRSDLRGRYRKGPGGARCN